LGFSIAERGYITMYDMIMDNFFLAFNIQLF